MGYEYLRLPRQQVALVPKLSNSNPCYGLFGDLHH